METNCEEIPPSPLTPTETNIPQMAAPLIAPHDIVISVMGMTGVGKSTFINLFSDVAVDIGHGLEACTAQVAIFPSTLPNGTRFFLVDTPGFDDTYKSDTDILREVSNWLAEAYRHQIKLSGIIYLHRILDVRVGGAAMKNLRMFKALCGEDGLGSVVLATTHWTGVSPENGTRREKELMGNEKMWKKMIEKGSKVFRQDRNVDSGMEIIQYLIDRKRRVTLDIQKDLVEKGMTLDKTAAGKEVTAESEKQRLKYEQELRELRDEMNDALAQKDRERQEEIKEYKAELEQKMKEERENMQKLHVEAEKLRKEMIEESKRNQEALLQQIKEKEKAMEREEARREEERKRMLEINAQNTKRFESQIEAMKAAYERSSRENAERAESERKALMEAMSRRDQEHKSQMEAMRTEFDRKSREQVTRDNKAELEAMRQRDQEHKAEMKALMAGFNRSSQEANIKAEQEHRAKLEAMVRDQDRKLEMANRKAEQQRQADENKWKMEREKEKAERAKLERELAKERNKSFLERLFQW